MLPNEQGLKEKMRIGMYENRVLDSDPDPDLHVSEIFLDPEFGSAKNGGFGSRIIYNNMQYSTEISRTFVIVNILSSNNAFKIND